MSSSVGLPLSCSIVWLFGVHISLFIFHEGSQSSPAQPAAQSFTQVTGAGAAAPPQKTAFDDLDALGQSLLQSSLLPNVRQAPTAKYVYGWSFDHVHFL